MDRRSFCAVMGFTFGCGPAVVLPDEAGSTSGFTSSAESAAMAASGPTPLPPATSTPPTPTTPTTTAPGTTTVPPFCQGGEQRDCQCPDGSLGWQVCQADGEFGPCECGFEGTTWWGESTGESSGGAPGLPDIPDLPPGETCLPVDMPCEGFFELSTNEHVEAVGTCSVILGSVFVVGEATTVEPLSCLREVSELFIIELVPLQSTAGLEALQIVDVFGVIGSSLTSFGAPNLEEARVLFADQNKQLTSLDFPSLTLLETLGMNFNPLLPTCEVEALYDQTAPPELVCESNLPDACSGLCM